MHLLEGEGRFSATEKPPSSMESSLPPSGNEERKVPFFLQRKENPSFRGTVTVKREKSHFYCPYGEGTKLFLIGDGRRKKEERELLREGLWESAGGEGTATAQRQAKRKNCRRPKKGGDNAGRFYQLRIRGEPENSFSLSN